MATFQSVSQKAKPGIKLAGRLALLAALRFGPAGFAAWAVKSVARRPLKMVLAVALEPLLTHFLRNVSERYERRMGK